MAPYKVKLNWIYRCGLQPTFNTINPSPYYQGQATQD
jgi:hypothetical protein